MIYRNGVSTGKSSYTLTNTDVGASFAAVATGKRPDYSQQDGIGTVVTFKPATATSSAVAGAAAPAQLPSQPDAAPAGSASAGDLSAAPISATAMDGGPATGTTTGTTSANPPDANSGTSTPGTAGGANTGGNKPSVAATKTALQAKASGNTAKISVSVTGAGVGQVTILDGSKTVGTLSLKNGTATLRLKRLKPGKHTNSPPAT